MLRVAWNTAAGQDTPTVNVVGAAGTLAPPAPTAPVQATTKAVDFSFKVLGTDETFKLSDFASKKAFVLYFNANYAEDAAISPTQMEQLCSIAKQYDPKKVVFLLLLGGDNFPYGGFGKWYNDRTNPEDNRRMQPPVPLRSYPGTVAYGYDMKGIDGKDAVDWRNKMEKFYFSGKFEGPSNGRFQDQSNRITVVDINGNVAGQVDFRVSDKTDYTKGDTIQPQRFIYKLNKDALDALIVQALSPQK
ncbi:MAG: hypothetical protein WKF37_17745 [Bryobacteraceae bacterium]